MFSSVQHSAVLAADHPAIAVNDISPAGRVVCPSRRPDRLDKVGVAAFEGSPRSQSPSGFNCLLATLECSNILLKSREIRILLRCSEKGKKICKFQNQFVHGFPSDPTKSHKTCKKLDHMYAGSLGMEMLNPVVQV